MSRFACAALGLFLILASRGVARAADEPRARALLLVDTSAYEALKPGLERYAAHVLQEFGVQCVARPDEYYAMKPPAIRAQLKAEYARRDQPPLVGAIMVGPIPYALRGDPHEIVFPAPLYYEDFDAEWNDRNGDGVYESDEITTDREHNPTEIWTAWWIPPALDRPTQITLVRSFLDKLDRYHRGEIAGRDQMLWLAGNVMDVEVCEGWTVLLKDTLSPLAQNLRIWCKVGQDEGTFRPNKRKDEFTPRDFLAAFSLQPWQHIHVIAHGNPRGWYWDTAGVVASAPASGPSEPVLLLDPNALHAPGANIITTSGCSNGNFRGDYLKPAYDRALGNRLLFAPETITIAYYGAASPQSTSGFAGYCTELIESLKADGGSYLAAGYFKMRNTDYAWGTQHYFFRGGDEKILCGDPFARYHDSPPFSPEQSQAIEAKIQAAGWTIVGPG
jgi:hypothetical protein